jgi:hypothetical protein
LINAKAGVAVLNLRKPLLAHAPSLPRYPALLSQKQAVAAKLSGKAHKGQNSQDNNNKADKINDTVHGDAPLVLVQDGGAPHYASGQAPFAQR